ncbi:hypothetical protein [Chthoniobacter flavus]|uniref:hypothetical protein n=1 Tax=Chthoniobacter flavus TaxID=191863 RepID=UPI0005B289A1|nr:hypothetical protein [Chthoniobacter flavus]
MAFGFGFDVPVALDDLASVRLWFPRLSNREDSQLYTRKIGFGMLCVGGRGSGRSPAKFFTEQIVDGESARPEGEHEDAGEEEEERGRRKKLVGIAEDGMKRFAVRP